MQFGEGKGLTQTETKPQKIDKWKRVIGDLMRETD